MKKFLQAITIFILSSWGLSVFAIPGKIMMRNTTNRVMEVAKVYLHTKDGKVFMNTFNGIQSHELYSSGEESSFSEFEHLTNEDIDKVVVQLKDVTSSPREISIIAENYSRCTHPLLVPKSIISMISAIGTMTEEKTITSKDIQFVTDTVNIPMETTLHIHVDVGVDGIRVTSTQWQYK
ncbi:MAG: hypothetical protein HRT87_05515 [Legionellales bacterium]|nr:hypothetical protein [Legionellales bacterium]